VRPRLERFAERDELVDPVDELTLFESWPLFEEPLFEEPALEEDEEFERTVGDPESPPR
jgi:hypothetical protein